MATERGRSGCRGLVVFAIVFASYVGLVPSCQNSGGGPGQGGSGGGASAGSGGGLAGSGGGNAGSGGTGGAASGGTPGFVGIAPCLNESDYVTDTTTVNFGLIDGAYKYEPKCLKLRTSYSPVGTAGAPGTDVTFSGDFTVHPLEPSAKRSRSVGNEIASTSSVPDGGTSKSFRFYWSGYYAYYCATHNPSDDGSAMSGVIWVEQIGGPTQ